MLTGANGLMFIDALTLRLREEGICSQQIPQCAVHDYKKKTANGKFGTYLS